MIHLNINCMYICLLYREIRHYLVKFCQYHVDRINRLTEAKLTTKWMQAIPFVHQLSGTIDNNPSTDLRVIMTDSWWKCEDLQSIVAEFTVTNPSWNA